MTTIKLEDAGFKSLGTMGSMVAGSSELSVASSAGFHVGDSIIVAVGGEAGHGMRGTAGVGGVYAATTNDTTQYYTNEDAPKALVAHIVSMGQDGHTLVLDRAASASTTGASIYYDNKPAWDAVVAANNEPNVTIKIPAGHFAISDPIAIAQRPGWTIEGAGKDKTEIFSPAGATSASLTVFQSDHVTLQDFALTGNAKMNGYGLGSGELYPPGIMFTLSDHGLAQDLTVTDVFQDAVGTRYSNDTWAYRVDAHLTEGLARYVQWQFDWANSTGGGVVDSSLDSPILANGFEGFQSKDVSFIGIHGTNASMSLNSSGNFLVKDAVLTVTPDSWVSDTSFHRFNPLIDVNSNINHSDPLLGLGGQIINATIVENGYIDKAGDILKGISIGSNNSNILVKGGIYVSPDGGKALISDGHNTVVDGFQVVGAAYANISVTDGIVKNSVAGSIDAPSGGVSNNSKPSASLLDHAAAILNDIDAAVISHAAPVVTPPPAPPVVVAPTVPDTHAPVVTSPAPVVQAPPDTHQTPVVTAPVTTTHDTGTGGTSVASDPFAQLSNAISHGASTGYAGLLSSWAAAVDPGSSHPAATNPAAASPFSGMFGGSTQQDALQSWASALQHGSSQADAATGIADSALANQHAVTPIDLGWHFG